MGGGGGFLSDFATEMKHISVVKNFNVMNRHNICNLVVYLSGKNCRLVSTPVFDGLRAF